MWFRNIHFYRFEEPFRLSGEQLHEALARHQARDCGQMEVFCEGWTTPLGRDGRMLVHESNACMMICLRREEKLLPASLVREQVEARAFEIEAEAGRAVGRKERMDIKDQILLELLPRALVRSSHTYAYIDAGNGWLIVNAASAKKSESLLALLRKSLGMLNVVLPQTGISPEGAMTAWMLDETRLPQGFAIEDECEFRSRAETTSIIRCKHVDVDTREIRAHVEAGKTVHRMAMNWQGKLSFVLHDDLSVRRMRFDNELLQQADDGALDDAARFDADFAIMSGELSEFIPALLNGINATGQ